MSIQFKNSFQSIGVKKLLHFFTNYWQWVTTICICHMKIMIHHTTMFFIWVIIRFMVSPRTFSTKEKINHSWPPRIQSSSRQPFPPPCQKKKEIRLLLFFKSYLCWFQNRYLCASWSDLILQYMTKYQRNIRCNHVQIV